MVRQLGFNNKKPSSIYISNSTAFGSGKPSPQLQFLTPIHINNNNKAESAFGSERMFADIFAFSNRWDLDTLEIVNKRSANVCRQYYSLKPYRPLHKLYVRLINERQRRGNDLPAKRMPCIARYRHQIKSLTIPQAYQLFSYPNVRFTSTHISLDADYAFLDEFFYYFRQLTHIWSDKALTIDMDHCLEPQTRQIKIYDLLFFGQFSRASQLAVLDRGVIYSGSYFHPFQYGTITKCRKLILAGGIIANLADYIVDYLHEDEELAIIGAPCKELIWTFLPDTAKNKAREVTYRIIGLLKQRFEKSEGPCPYRCWILNLVTPPMIVSKANGVETWKARWDVYNDKRYHSQLCDSNFFDDSVDVKIERESI
ncbi:hypothetical protein Ddc_19779 [Ditylenchus destructor]|nr:hypothetical protein Ddc_19779 [Ditylenchus destructor]